MCAHSASNPIRRSVKVAVPPPDLYFALNVVDPAVSPVKGIVAPIHAAMDAPDQRAMIALISLAVMVLAPEASNDMYPWTPEADTLIFV